MFSCERTASGSALPPRLHRGISRAVKLDPQNNTDFFWVRIRVHDWAYKKSDFRTVCLIRRANPLDVWCPIWCHVDVHETKMGNLVRCPVTPVQHDFLCNAATD